MRSNQALLFVLLALLCTQQGAQPEPVQPESAASKTEASKSAPKSAANKRVSKSASGKSVHTQSVHPTTAQQKTAPVQAQEMEIIPIGVRSDGKPITITRKKVVIPPQKLNLPIADNSLWFRYYQAGEDASLTQHDPDLAKKYWMAAISELEKHPPAKGADMFLSVRLSALDKGLMDSYPSDWSKQTGDSDEIMKQRKEQVDTLSRIARINEYFAPPDDLLRTKSKERYEIAKQAYEKALAQMKQKETKETKETSSD